MTTNPASASPPPSVPVPLQTQAQPSPQGNPPASAFVPVLAAIALAGHYVPSSMLGASPRRATAPPLAPGTSPRGVIALPPLPDDVKRRVSHSLGVGPSPKGSPPLAPDAAYAPPSPLRHLPEAASSLGSTVRSVASPAAGSAGGAALGGAGGGAARTSLTPTRTDSPTTPGVLSTTTKRQSVFSYRTRELSGGSSGVFQETSAPPSARRALLNQTHKELADAPLTPTAAAAAATSPANTLLMPPPPGHPPSGRRLAASAPSNAQAAPISAALLDLAFSAHPEDQASGVATATAAAPQPVALPAQHAQPSGSAGTNDAMAAVFLGLFATPSAQPVEGAAAATILQPSAAPTTAPSSDYPFGSAPSELANSGVAAAPSAPLPASLPPPPAQVGVDPRYEQAKGCRACLTAMCRCLASCFKAICCCCCKGKEKVVAATRTRTDPNSDDAPTPNRQPTPQPVPGGSGGTTASAGSAGQAANAIAAAQPQSGAAAAGSGSEGGTKANALSDMCSPKPTTRALGASSVDDIVTKLTKHLPDDLIESLQKRLGADLKKWPAYTFGDTNTPPPSEISLMYYQLQDLVVVSSSSIDSRTQTIYQNKKCRR